jgi:hypothetical protein
MIIPDPLQPWGIDEAKADQQDRECLAILALAELDEVFPESKGFTISQIAAMVREMAERGEPLNEYAVRYRQRTVEN